MIHHLDIDDIRLAWCPLDAGKPHIEARRDAVDALADALVPGAVIAHRPSGAPYIPGCGLHVSVSHTREAAIVAVARHPVGIDIEGERPRLASLVTRVAAQAELACMTPLQLWTAKEAVFKCADTLSRPPAVLSEICIDTPRTAHVDGTTFTVSHHTLFSGIMLAVATR